METNKKNEISPIYLLYGKESFLINETKQTFNDQILKEEEKEFNLSNYDLDETPIDEQLRMQKHFLF